MADAMVESRPRLRFFCHRCRLEFRDVEQESVCPYCDGGFIEQIDGDSDRVTAFSSDGYSDADMSYVDYMTVDEVRIDESDGFNTTTIHAPTLNDLAFLMSGRRRRTLLSNNSPLYTTANITVNGTANNAANGTANNAANGTANNAANGTANNAANSTANNAANGTANNAANGTANNAANGTANDAVNCTANNAANCTANNTANCTANNAANCTANIAANGTANSTANSAANGTANNPPNGTSTSRASANTTTTGNISGGSMPRGHTLMEELLWMVSGGRPPAGGVAGTPFVLVGSPGDYVLGGEGLDAVVTQLLGQLEHTGPPPLPRERLASLPTAQVSAEQAAANIACSVCWENFQLESTVTTFLLIMDFRKVTPASIEDHLALSLQSGEPVTKLECEHTFHQGCITPWLELHATCPVCRRSLLPPAPPAAPSAPSTTTASTTSTSSTTATPPSTTGMQHIRLRTPLSSLIVNTTPRIVIQRRTGTLPTLIRRIPSQTHTWDSLNDTSTSGSMSPASSVTAGGLWATQNRSSNSTGPTNSSTSLNSNDRDSTRQYHTDMEYD